MGAWPSLTGVWGVSLAVACWAGCSNDPPSATEPSTSPTATNASATAGASSSAAPTGTANEPPGDKTRGKELAGKFECGRCHGGLDTETIPSTSHCVQCHEDVMAGKYDSKPDHKKWKKNVAHLVAVPSLAGAGARLKYAWLVDYLMEPHDLRPNLVYNMPRLALTRAEARDIATYVTSLAEAPSEPANLDGADLAAGKKLLNDKGCGSCHTMGRTDTFTATPKTEERRVAVMLAPDLAHARERLRPDAILAWLRDPQKMKPGTEMPKTAMTDAEANNIVAYLLKTPLAEAKVPAVPPVPEALERKVTFDEVNEKIFAKICRHCHGNPDEGVGDGGPGNTGGFGFKPRGLELTSYKRVMAGYTDDTGERHSVFKKTKSGQPRLVASLMARYAEVAGKPDDEVRGMPLALPPLPIEDIQLLVTWIAQGRKR